MTGHRPPLRDALGDYLSLRRALGFQLANAGRLLGQFVGYLEAHGMDTITTEHALAWATQPAGASAHWRAIRLSAVRGFAGYLHGLDPSVEAIPAGQFRPGVCRATPYCTPRPRSARSSGGGRPAAPAAGGHLPDPDQPACDHGDVLWGSSRAAEVWSSCLRSSEADRGTLSIATGVVQG